MVRAAKQYQTRAHEGIEKYMERFKPRFGNDEDMSIITQYGKIKKLLADVNASEMRQLELKREESKMTSKMKEIRSKEKQLVFAIKKRNETTTEI